MSIAEKYRPYYTYKDYCLWEGRWELIGGLPYAMSPAPNWKHQRIANKLGSKFEFALSGCKKCMVLQPIDWKISDNTVVQPDVSIVCKAFNNPAYLDFPPALVVEILSPSTVLKDRREKYDLYASQDVKYYIIIDPGFNKIEIFQNSDLHQYQPVAVNPENFSFTLGENCTTEIDFKNLFEE